MDVGWKRQQSFGSTHHGMEPPSCALFKGCIQRSKQESSQVQNVPYCLLHQQGHFQGCACLVLSRSGNVQYQKFRRIAENVTMKWKQLCRWYCRILIWSLWCGPPVPQRHAQLAISFIRRWAMGRNGADANVGRSPEHFYFLIMESLCLF